jgi:hypothetical protein
MQTLSQSFDLAKDLGTLTGRQAVKVFQRRRAVFNRVTMTIHRIAYTAGTASRARITRAT